MENQMQLCISRLKFGLNTVLPLCMAENFHPFLEEGVPEIEISFRETSAISVDTGRQVYRDEDIAVYDMGGEFVRFYHMHGGDLDTKLRKVYASFCYDWETGRGEVQYAAEKRDRFQNIRGCFAHLGFEDLLMSRNRMALHASLIETEFGGVLFSGVSGIGKSTQADLWHQYEGSRILNGDRPILYKNGEQWEAYGSPFAGSSRYYVNEGVPVRAIVLLEQGSDCQIRRTQGAEAFCGIYAGTTVNDWNPRYVDRVSSMISDLVQCVPIYHYSCTPDETAVSTLKEELCKGGR